MNPKFDQNGLVPIIAQDAASGAVLMLAYGNAASIKLTEATAKMTYWSRSRQEIWVKGETSGHTQKFLGWKLDCDGDALLAQVEQTGPACHTGTETCWGEASAGVLGHLAKLFANRRSGEGYTGKLLADPDFALAKVLEESEEVAAVLRGEDNADDLAHEAADLIFHLLAACEGAGTSVNEVLGELQKRVKS
jgi:phosphoribosyl-ATP pyrophosphohydrolase/phosphoribosyl-AMP cyclohydrolase